MLGVLQERFLGVEDVRKSTKQGPEVSMAMHFYCHRDLFLIPNCQIAERVVSCSSRGECRLQLDIFRLCTIESLKTGNLFRPHDSVRIQLPKAAIRTADSAAMCLQVATSPPAATNISFSREESKSVSILCSKALSLK